MVGETFSGRLRHLPPNTSNVLFRPKAPFKRKYIRRFDELPPTDGLRYGRLNGGQIIPSRGGSRVAWFRKVDPRPRGTSHIAQSACGGAQGDRFIG